MKTIFTLLFTLSVVTTFAQRNFVPGQYTTLQGETVQAHIDDQNWDRNPEYIDVKSDPSSQEIKRLYLADITGFSLSTGDIFERYIVDVDKSPTKLEQIVSNDPIIERDTVFLRALVIGSANLYFLKDDLAKEHYYLKAGEEDPLELIYKIALVTDGNKSGYTKLPIYKGMLSIKLSSCHDLSDKIQKVDFKMDDLKDIVRQYNACMGGAEDGFATAKEKIKLNLIALGGTSYTVVDFSGDGFTSLIGKEFEGIGYTFGVSMLATLPRARGKWAIRNDLMYKPFKLENVYEKGNNVGEENYTRVATTFNMAYVGLNTGLRYKILEAGIKPYVILGMANNFLVQNKSIQDTYRRYYTVESSKQESPLDDYRGYEQALLFGAGVEVKRIIAEIKYESGNGFSPYTNLVSSHRTFSFQLGYTFK